MIGPEQAVDHAVVVDRLTIPAGNVRRRADRERQVLPVKRGHPVGRRARGRLEHATAVRIEEPGFLQRVQLDPVAVLVNEAVVKAASCRVRSYAG